MNFLIDITNKEAKLLRKLGVKDGENGICHSHGHNRHYYLTETEKNLTKLSKIRG